MEKGTIKFFNENKGFGFIKAQSGKEVFVHSNDLREHVRENDEVVFDMREGQRGPQAVNVRLA